MTGKTTGCGSLSYEICFSRDSPICLRCCSDLLIGSVAGYDVLKESGYEPVLIL